MAKEINTIQCPQCQSVKNVKLAENLYLCSNCGTEYFQDKDKEIHVHIHHNKAPQVESFFTKHKKPILLGLFVFLLMVMILPSLFSTNSLNNNDTSDYSGRILQVISAPQETVENPMVLLVMSKHYDDSSISGNHVVRFYDILEDRLFPPIPITLERYSSMRSRTFSSGKNYLIFNNNEFVYEVDYARQEFKNVTDQIFEGNPEFASGIASVEFRTNGDGFEGSTNNGQQFHYFPESNELFTTNEAVREAIKQNRAQAKKLKEFYLFTQKSTYYPDEKIQLIKYWFPDSHPRKLPWKVRWADKYDYASKRRKKFLFYEQSLGYHPDPIKFEDLTPDRLYFDQKIAYQDSENLYVTGKVSANKNAKTYVQRINTETGKIEWNLTLENPEDEFDRYQGFQAYKNGLIAMYHEKSEGKSRRMMKVIDKNGVVLKELDLDTMF